MRGKADQGLLVIVPDIGYGLFRGLVEWATWMSAVPVEVKPEALILLCQMAVNQVTVEFGLSKLSMALVELESMSPRYTSV